VFLYSLGEHIRQSPDPGVASEVPEEWALTSPGVFSASLSLKLWRLLRRALDIEWSLPLHICPTCRSPVNVPPIRTHSISALAEVVASPMRDLKLLLGIIGDEERTNKEKKEGASNDDMEDTSVWDYGVWMEDEHGVQQLRVLGHWGAFGLFSCH